MADFMIMAILLILVGAALFYIRKEKKKGVRCIGCPSGGMCAHKHGETSGCGCSGDSGCGCQSAK